MISRKLINLHLHDFFFEIVIEHISKGSAELIWKIFNVWYYRGRGGTQPNP